MVNRNIMRERLIDSEKLVESTLVNLVKSKSGLCIKLVTTHFSGLPDRLVLLPDKVIFFVELKTTGLSAKKLQKKVHTMITKLGFEVYIIDTVQKVKDLIK